MIKVGQLYHDCDDQYLVVTYITEQDGVKKYSVIINDGRVYNNFEEKDFNNYCALEKDYDNWLEAIKDVLFVNRKMKAGQIYKLKNVLYVITKVIVSNDSYDERPNQEDYVSLISAIDSNGYGYYNLLDHCDINVDELKFIKEYPTWQEAVKDELFTPKN